MSKNIIFRSVSETCVCQRSAGWTSIYIVYAAVVALFIVILDATTVDENVVQRLSPELDECGAHLNGAVLGVVAMAVA